MENPIWIAIAVVLVFLMLIFGPLGVAELFFCDYVGMESLSTCQ